MTSYSKTSAYYKTDTYDFFLDVTQFRDIPRISTDDVYRIGGVYQYRPDLLAYDLYGDANLWWVFIARNPNTLQDPIFDFVIGTTIYLPTKETLTTALGL